MHPPTIWNTVDQHQGWGYKKSFSLFCYFSSFSVGSKHDLPHVYHFDIWQISFIFGRCLYSLAVATSAKYEDDLAGLTYTSAKAGISLMATLMNGALATPTPDILKILAINSIPLLHFIGTYHLFHYHEGLYQYFPALRSLLTGYRDSFHGTNETQFVEEDKPSSLRPYHSTFTLIKKETVFQKKLHAQFRTNFAVNKVDNDI